MTTAICLACGLEKFGAFVGCDQCRYRPLSGWEMAVSAICSDRILAPEALKNLANDIQFDRAEEEVHVWNFDPGAIDFITQQMDNPDWRDALTLKRAAKDGLFKKQMNWHYTGPDGYRSEVVARGSDFEKDKFDKAFDQYGRDVFLVEAYIDGKKSVQPTLKSIWYCMYDIMSFGIRKSKLTSLEEEVIVINAENFVYDYLY